MEAGDGGRVLTGDGGGGDRPRAAADAGSGFRGTAVERNCAPLPWRAEGGSKSTLGKVRWASGASLIPPLGSGSEKLWRIGEDRIVEVCNSTLGITAFPGSVTGPEAEATAS